MRYKLDWSVYTYLTQLYGGRVIMNALSLGTANINAYLQDTGLPVCFFGWQV